MRALRVGEEGVVVMRTFGEAADVFRVQLGDVHIGDGEAPAGGDVVFHEQEGPGAIVLLGAHVLGFHAEAALFGETVGGLGKAGHCLDNGHAGAELIDVLIVVEVLAAADEAPVFEAGVLHFRINLAVELHVLQRIDVGVVEGDVQGFLRRDEHISAAGNLGQVLRWWRIAGEEALGADAGYDGLPVEHPAEELLVGRGAHDEVFGALAGKVDGEAFACVAEGGVFGIAGLVGQEAGVIIGYDGFVSFVGALGIPGKVADGEGIVGGEAVHIVARNEAGIQLLLVDARSNEGHGGVIQRAVEDADAGRELNVLFLANGEIAFGVEAFNDRLVTLIELVGRNLFLLTGKCFEGDIGKGLVADMHAFKGVINEQATVFISAEQEAGADLVVDIAAGNGQLTNLLADGISADAVGGKSLVGIIKIGVVEGVNTQKGSKAFIGKAIGEPGLTAGKRFFVEWRNTGSIGLAYKVRVVLVEIVIRLEVAGEASLFLGGSRKM